MTAQEIFETQLGSWGERDIYLVSEEEFLVLLSDGGNQTEIDKSNGDGTFFNSLVFKNHKFCSTTSVELFKTGGGQ